MRVKAKAMDRREYLYVRVSASRKAKLKKYVQRLQREGSTTYRPDLRMCVQVKIAEWIDSLPNW